MKNSKEKTVTALVFVGIVFGIFVNPADDSQTWLSDFLVTKTIAAIALFSAIVIAIYHNQTTTS